MSMPIVTVIAFGVLLLVLALGIPFVVALGGVGVILILVFWGVSGLYLVGIGVFSRLTDFTFIAIPLFIFMANMLEKSGIAEDLYEAVYGLFGSIRGGLAVGTVAACAIFAAMVGITGAATVSMGIIALPQMLKRGYSKDLAVGCIAAGGALGILIPPSVTMIIYGVIGEVSVGRLYAGGYLPGLLLAALFCAYIMLRSFLQPDIAPVIPPEERYSWREKLISLKGLIIPVALIGAILGCILTGFTSVSEASGIGALGSIIVAGIHRRLNFSLLNEVCKRTALLSCLVMWIIMGAIAFSVFYTGMGAGNFIRELVLGLGVNRWIIVIGMQVVLIILGCVMDTAAILMITVPVFAPIIVRLGFDPVWFGVLFVVNMEMGFLTPPFGYNLFYMKGVAPPEITMLDIYRSIVPFVGLQLIGLILCMIFPIIIMAVPNVVFR